VVLQTFLMETLDNKKKKEKKRLSGKKGQV